MTRDEPFRASPFDGPAHADSASDRARRYSTTQPQCELCFKRSNPGKVIPRSGLRELERCCSCGSWRADGIYVKVDLASAPYPSLLVDGGRERF